MGPDLWRRIDAVVRDRVDELITAPIKQAELKARLENLLQSRALSVELREQRDALRTLDRLNVVIRSIDQSLVQASTREEIEQAVCERLVDVDRYVGAWIGNDRATTRTVVSRATAGVVGTLPDEEGGPTTRTVETGERTVVRSVHEGEDEWHDAASDVDVTAAIAIPIVYEATTYGVLTVYADDPEAFGDEEEVAVLCELGETIGHAINAADSRRALLTDRVTQFEFGIDAPDAPLRGLATAANCSFEFRGIVSATDGSYLEYYSASVDDPETLVEAADGVDDVERIRHVGDHGGESLFELRFDQHVVQTIGALGGRATALQADSTGYRVTAEFPRDADRHTVVDSLATAYGSATLLAQRETEREFTSQQEIWESFRSRLTDQQWRALKAAHLAGFFEWPRGSTGEEVADSLDISAPTFHEHLRAAQRKLLETLVDD
nr:bacterio-opsin activator domain-containing protein [Halomarina oriensis]